MTRRNACLTAAVAAVIAIAAILSGATAVAEEATSHWDMDSAERDLELWRHELLAGALSSL